MYIADEHRYDTMQYRRCGKSGSASRPSPSASGTTSAESTSSRIAAPWCCRAFDLGITHFDLANNYGPPPG